MQPLVMSWAVRVDPLLVLIAITVGAQVLGLVGALIAVPVAGMAQVITQRASASDPSCDHDRNKASGDATSCGWEKVSASFTASPAPAPLKTP